MIAGVPSTKSETTQGANPFAAIITADAVIEILTKQVEKARAGDTASAKLVLKIAAAEGGRDSSSRRNPDTPTAKPPTMAMVIETLRRFGSSTIDQLAARFSCDTDDVRLLLERSPRVATNGRGIWSLAPVSAIGEA